MELDFDKQTVRTDVVEALRDLADRSAGVWELVECVQSKLGLKQYALLPLLWYLMKAFHLPLGDVLPIREWLGTDGDQEIDDAVLPAIRRNKARWETEAKAGSAP